MLSASKPSHSYYITNYCPFGFTLTARNVVICSQVWTTLVVVLNEHLYCVLQTYDVQRVMLYGMYKKCSVVLYSKVLTVFTYVKVLSIVRGQYPNIRAS